MQIRYRLRGNEKVQEYLKSIPRGALPAALQAFTEYIIGDTSHGLKHPDPYKYVSRKAAYGVSFFTDKQRRWFFWALNTGQINPGQNNRTGESTDAWQYVEVSKYKYTITNPTTGAYYTRDNAGQARQPAKVGWRKVAAVISANMAGAMRSANAAVKAFLKLK